MPRACFFSRDSPPDEPYAAVRRGEIIRRRSPAPRLAGHRCGEQRPASSQLRSCKHAADTAQGVHLSKQRTISRGISKRAFRRCRSRTITPVQLPIMCPAAAERSARRQLLAGAGAFVRSAHCPNADTALFVTRVRSRSVDGGWQALLAGNFTVFKEWRGGCAERPGASGAAIQRPAPQPAAIRLLGRFGHKHLKSWDNFLVKIF